MCCCLKMILDYGNCNFFLITLNVYSGKDGEISICDQTREIREYAYAYNPGFFYLFIVSRTPRTEYCTPHYKPQFSQFFDKIPVRTLLDVLFPVFRFSEASFNAPTPALIGF